MSTSESLLRAFGAKYKDYIIALLCVMFIVFLISLDRLSVSREAVSTEIDQKESEFFDNLSLDAKTVYVYDVKEGKALYSKNATAQLPLASLTKIMMAITALSIIPEGATVTVNPEFLESEGDSGLYGNERWKLSDLLDFTLLESSNDGANAIAAVAGATKRAGLPDELGRLEFIGEMNRNAKILGLAETYYLNPTGLDENHYLSGGYGSARDVASLFSFALSRYPKLFGSTRHVLMQFDSLSSLKHQAKNTNAFISRIPSLLASKTGYTDLAGGNLVIAFDAGPDRPIVISILGSTEDGRFKDSEKLVWATLEYFDNQ